MNRNLIVHLLNILVLCVQCVKVFTVQIVSNWLHLFYWQVQVHFSRLRWVWLCAYVVLK